MGWCKSCDTNRYATKVNGAWICIACYCEQGGNDSEWYIARDEMKMERGF